MATLFNARLKLVFLSASCVSAAFSTPQTAVNFDSVQKFLKIHCQSCHNGKTAVGGFDLRKLSTPESLRSEAHKWASAATRVKNGEMPPKGAPALPLDLRESFTNWVDETLRAEACSTDTPVRPTPVRRLNRDEYSATVRDLLSINMDVGHALPADGAGGEGFDNAAETLFLSPIHAEKFLDAARSALDFAATDSRARARIFISKPGAGVSEEDAARQIIEAFLPRAFRRPIVPAEAAPYQVLFNAARKDGETFDRAVLFALRGILVSPQFLFRVDPQRVDDYAFASRLSYFLWGTMPDELLFDIAASGRLQEPEILKGQIGRMLRSPRSLAFVHRFVEQWLRTRDLGGEKTLDPDLFSVYAGDEELRSDIKYQPVIFFRELLVKDHSLLNLLDSKWTIGTRKLVRLYGIKTQVRRETPQNLHRVELPEGSDRGGLLGMSAVLATTSYPNRTSPVLRGAWILDTILGTPPPPPPPNVPKLEEEAASHPESVRERLTQHRENPACAGCHARIDGLGFALENYDALGRWRTEDGGKPIDAAGELADGSRFNGPAELKATLLNKKDLFIRNLTSKMLGYALGRGLTLKDSCTVDSILTQLQARDYGAQALVEAIAFSEPFRVPVAKPSPGRTAGAEKRKPRS